jgi:polar amino acid transport system substrate-binding protein
MDASSPPFEMIAMDGALVGFDVDLAREVGQRLGVEVQFVANLPYDGLYDALSVGRVDVVVSALVVNPARTVDFAFSTPYFDAGQVLVAREGSNVSRHRLTDVLAGGSLAVEFGTRGDQEARKWGRRSPDLTVVPFQTAAEAVGAVAAGEADAALVDHVSALEATARWGGTGTGLVIVGTPLVREPYAVAVCRESRHLLREIDRALGAMEADGTLEMLRAKWFRASPD